MRILVLIRITNLRLLIKILIRIRNKLKEFVITQNQRNLTKLLKTSNSSLLRKNQRKINKGKPQVLSKSSNPFSKQDNGNFITESSA